MTTRPVLEGQKHKFILIPSIREFESTVHYDVFRQGHKVARISIEAIVQVALEDERTDILDLEDDITHIFGTDDFTYVDKTELSGVN